MNFGLLCVVSPVVFDFSTWAGLHLTRVDTSQQIYLSSITCSSQVARVTDLLSASQLLLLNYTSTARWE
ncbi:MAG: hypothetical protein KME59_03880 [Trichormus sp. ATA11-4-KO1]|nr:hypothetical protein [Trichormus sp. ATA11-4-KO1]